MEVCATQKRRKNLLAGLSLLAVFGVTGAAQGYDPQQSTGTGTVQGEDASITTKRGGNTGETTGRNEHSGSATGTARDRTQSEPKADPKGGSSQLGSDSSHESSQREAGTQPKSHSQKSAGSQGR
jgi:hypothetical protein